MTPRQVSLLAVFGAVVLAALAPVVLHVPTGWSVLIAEAAGTALVAVLGTARAPKRRWPAPPEVPESLPGRQFTWLLDGFGADASDGHRFRSRLRPQLQRIALHRLRRRPGTTDITSLHDPRAAEALGPKLYALLTDPDASRPDPAELSTMLDRLEEL